MYRAPVLAGAALAFGAAVFGTLALVHFSTQYYLDLEIAESLHTIDKTFAEEMQRRCGGPESAWKPLPSGRGYQCYDKRGRAQLTVPAPAK